MGFIKIILGAVDLGLAIAEKVDQALDKRKARKAEAKGLTYKDVQTINKQIESATTGKNKTNGR